MTTRAGFAGANKPHISFPSLVARGCPRGTGVNNEIVRCVTIENLCNCVKPDNLKTAALYQTYNEVFM